METPTTEFTWKSAVAEVLRQLPREFRLEDVRNFNAALHALFPSNNHIDAKVRQTLQILRDRGQIEFLGGGRYRKIDVAPRFSCLIDTTRAADYKSRSQIARVLIEPWAELNLYCLDCPSDDISALPNNAKVADFQCPVCSAAYQVKSSDGRFRDVVHGGEFRTYARAAEDGMFPNLFLVEWDSRFSCVFVVRAISGTHITAENLAPRRPLGVGARRTGWQGCTINVAGLPWVGLVTPELRDPTDCRAEWRHGTPESA